LISSEAEEAKFELTNASDGKSMTNEFESCPSSLEEARKRNRRIIEVWKLTKLSVTKTINFDCSIKGVGTVAGVLEIACHLFTARGYFGKSATKLL
jgi:hypothetical protein